MSRKLFPVLLLVCAALGVARMQPHLATTLHDVKMKEDVYVLPPPTHLKVMTLGYMAAAVDQLWAKLLIEFGTHAVEKRDFEDAPLYLDAILELEPDYAPAYKFADTLMVYRRNGPGTADDARLARKYLERGTRERPYDAEVWMHYGQFVAFMPNSYLHDREEIDQWRRDGALAIAHAVELGENVDRGLGAAGVLGKTGERDAQIKHLQRLLALTDDPDKREEISAQLRTLLKTDEEDRVVTDFRLLEGEWKRRYSFVSRSMFLLIGPDRSAARCVGPGSADEPECPDQWDERLEQLRK